ncbi:unnamed protein product, partial [Allacma fusca]
VGTRVVRGTDWKRDDQDGTPPGEGQVISLDVHGLPGIVKVKLTSGKTNYYRMEGPGKYDLKLVECSLTIKDPTKLDCLKSNAPKPSGSEMASRLKFGTLVVRGADWKYSNQNGNPPGLVTSTISETGWKDFQIKNLKWKNFYPTLNYNWRNNHRASRSYGIKLTNYSKSTLLRPSYFVPPDGGDKCRLPSCIDVGKSKAICFQGRGETCSFLLSFDIGTTSLCLIIYGVVFDWNRLAGSNYCQLGIGISASDLPMVESLYDTWRLNSFLPYDWVKSIHGVTCLMELGNGLDVPIKLRGCMSCERSRMLTEVPPLGLEMFCLTGKMSIEATFAYEIESTDLGLLIAVKAGENENKFAAVFHPVSEIMFDADLDKLLNPDMWGYLLNQKFTHAKGGEQIIQTRNIRANVTMTEGQKSQVKIRLYAV